MGIRCHLIAWLRCQYYLWPTCLWVVLSETLCLSYIITLGALLLIKWLFGLSWVVFSCLFDPYLPPLTQFFCLHDLMMSFRLECICLWYMLYRHFYFWYIPWFYCSDFETDNHSCCHGADVIYLVHWIAVTIYVSDIRAYSFSNNCANVTWNIPLHSMRALGKANILWIPLMLRLTGKLW